MSSELADLYFGRDDAETDMTEGGLLRVGFLHTHVYSAARRARKHLIIGRKGSGKSAICRMLAAEDDPDQVTVLVTPDALSAEEIRRFELQGIPPEMAKKLIWRYVLAVQVARHLVLHAEDAHGKAKHASVQALRTFLVANGELEDTRPKFWQIVQKLRTSLSLEAFGVSATVDFGGPSEGIRTANQLDVVEKNLQQAIADLRCPPGHPRLLLLVDQIEDVWANDGESDTLVIGLLRAAREATSRYARVACVVFLRDDIYDLLQFPDRDKLHGDEMRVDWTAQRLLDLVLTRARASLGLDELTPAELWGSIFPGTVGGIPTQDYLVAHTLMRPRDIIHLCNLCRDTAEHAGHDAITEKDVAEAILQYSAWKLQDLSNEYLANYPFLDGLFAVFRDHGYIVTRAALDTRLEGPLELLRRRFRERASGLTTDGVLDVLYDIGFLGVRRNTHVIYSHDHHDRIEFADREFHVHPCFRPALRATAATSGIAYNRGAVEGRVLWYMGGGNLTLGRGGFEQQALKTVRQGILRLLDRLDGAGLPTEVRHEIAADLHRIRKDAKRLRHLSEDDALDWLDLIHSYLRDLSRRLENDGFNADPNAMSFLRSISALADRVRAESLGTYRGGAFGSDSGSGH